MKQAILWFLLSVCLLPAWGQTDFSSIDSLMIRMLPQGAECGISVYDLTAQKSLYTYREQKLARPASTQKLLTAIAALSHPQGEAPFRTEVWYDGSISGDTLHGDLYVVGGFDPEFDEKAMDALVEEIASLPFTVLRGHIYGDLSLKDSLYWGSGWAWDDNPEAFQPYLSPLMFCKGAVEVKAFPGGERGNLARLVCKPASSYYSVLNQTRTRMLSAGKFSVKRDWMNNRNQLLVTGNVETPTTNWINLYSSQDFFLFTFIERLRARGVETPDRYTFRTFTPSAHSHLAAAWETPLQQVIDQLMKESDNLNGEALLYRLGAQATGEKAVSAEAGLDEIRKLMVRLGHDPKQSRIADGCGLSNYNYLTPALLIDFLKYAYSQRDLFARLYQSLPIAGVDGTLKNRMKSSAAYKNVRAKTGSFTAINTLAGYLTLKNGHDVAFVIMNQNLLSAPLARAFQDKVCELICR